jgi:glyoxylase-like metal-dependent hydrolase (beta-lactamase superfamily II)
LSTSEASDGWFQVYEAADRVYAIAEPYHFQETLSYLIVGDERAILFDTGMGFVPISPVVARLTQLPVTVLNSHTHYDHVGGNSEFSSVLAVASEFTRSNMAGFQHERLAGDLGPDAFCRGVPAGFDPGAFHTRAWKASGHVADGDILDLGGRELQVLQVPGHTPDAIALFDAGSGLLFTGDTYYDGPIWLFAPETSLADYASSIARLSDVEASARYLFGAHNIIRVDAGTLARVAAAFGKLRSGAAGPAEKDGGGLLYTVDGIRFLTSESALRGQQGDVRNGGSGLDQW